MNVMLRTVMLLFGLSLASCASTQLEPDDTVVEIPMLYITDRDETGDEDPEKFYGDERGDLVYGSMTTILEAKPTGASPDDPAFWQPRAANADDIGIASLKPMALDGFQQEIETRLQGRDDKTALVFLHGYKKTFRRAAMNLAGIVYGANYQGIPVLYSWPSGGAPALYAADTTNLKWSTTHLVKALDQLAEVHGLDVIHLVAHSMGGQAVLHALENEKPPQGEGEWKLGELILYSPDVDRARFARDALPKLRAAGIRTTVYASDLDVPLWASRFANKYPRLGDAASGLLVAEGLETIDASQIAGLFTGHIYHLGQRTQDDLHYLLSERLGAAERPTLTRVEDERGVYWEILPE